MDENYNKKGENEGINTNNKKLNEFLNENNNNKLNIQKNKSIFKILNFFNKRNNLNRNTTMIKLDLMIIITQIKTEEINFLDYH